LKTVLAIIGVGVGVTSLGAVVAAAGVTAQLPDASFRVVFTKWFFSRGVGLLLMVPLVLTWSDVVRRGWALPGWRSLVEPAGCLLITLSAAQFVFGADWLPTLSVLDHPYLLAPFFIWAGLRLHPRMVTLILVLTSVVLVLHAQAGYGPFSPPDDRLPPAEAVRKVVLEIQAFLAVMTGSTLVLSAVVTDRRRAQVQLQRTNAELAQSEERFRLAIEAVGEGAYDLNVQTGEVRVTDQWLQSLGFPPQQQPLGIDFWRDLIHPEDRARVLAELEDHLAGRTDRFESEYRLRKQSGEYRWNRDRGRVLTRADDGTPLRMVGTEDDVTLRKTADERLRHMEAKLAHVSRLSAMGELVAEIAHEVNQPLYSIVNFAKASRNLLGQSDRPDLELLQEWSEQIGEAAVRAGAIVKRLRAFARRGDSEREAADANAIVGEVCELMDFSVRKCGVRVQLQLAPDLPPVFVDRVRIQQVLVNLLQNACEAIQQAGAADRRVMIRTKRLGDRVGVTVADTGPGLPKGDDFNPFDTFVTTKPQGMGMGLAISRTIIEAHGGRLWATAADLGGAEFLFTLPTEKGDERDAD
jgi:PAS domain S-box-containing protein